MKNYLLLIIFCITSVGCQSFRGDRKPQSAGFAGYCPTCITKNIDKDLAKLNNIIKVSHTIDSYKTDVDNQCAEGFTEGIKREHEDHHEKECLNTKLVSGQNKYRTDDVDGKCAKGFVEGIRIKHKYDYDEKECLNKNWVSRQNKYQMHINGKCAKGFVAGVRAKKPYDYYKPIECKRIKPLHL